MNVSVCANCHCIQGEVVVAGQLTVMVPVIAGDGSACRHSFVSLLVLVKTDIAAALGESRFKE
jgi:hypothetical protein